MARTPNIRSATLLLSVCERVQRAFWCFFNFSVSLSFPFPTRRPLAALLYFHLAPAEQQENAIIPILLSLGMSAATDEKTGEKGKFAWRNRRGERAQFFFFSFGTDFHLYSGEHLLRFRGERKLTI